MNKENAENAINKFIALFKRQSFSSNEDTELFLREKISALVEEIYKEELKIADDRWKLCEEKLKRKEDN